jgi:hypothetical protein
MFFEMADYPNPAGPLSIYRGATRGRARGMAWTTDPDKARWFADRFSGLAGQGPFRAAHVYTVTAPPAAILCIVDEVDRTAGRSPRSSLTRDY